MDCFDKSFTQQEPIPEAAIARAVGVMRSGRLHRYNLEPGEAGPVSELEHAFAAYIGKPYCLAVTSGGQAMQIALRAAGIRPGDRVLTNAFTLAPVPGAIALVGAQPVLLETTEQLRPDLADLEAKAAPVGARALLLSNMRGHLPDMDAVAAICARHGLILIEDCAHTMGATWKGRASGTFGLAGCFSTQTYKHMNSGEGGLLVSSDAEFMARATILSGSYMMFGRHGAGPAEAEFDRARYQMPNGSARMDAIRAALLLDQIASLPDRIERWNALYRAMEAGLASLPGLTLPQRPDGEGFVGSSIQFLAAPDWTAERCRAFVRSCAARGVELKWFGATAPHGFTSRFDHWHFAPQTPLPRSAAVLARLFDMRLPLTFTPADCRLIARIITEETARMTEPA
jgi:dTDP-4-amino-4,6-dideoxygalactose transaminase